MLFWIILNKFHNKDNIRVAMKNNVNVFNLWEPYHHNYLFLYLCQYHQSPCTRSYCRMAWSVCNNMSQTNLWTVENKVARSYHRYIFTSSQYAGWLVLYKSGSGREGFLKTNINSGRSRHVKKMRIGERSYGGGLRSYSGWGGQNPQIAK